MVLGRLVLLLQAEKYLFIRRTWLTKIFVGGDVLSFIVQGAGEYAAGWWVVSARLILFRGWDNVQW